ncbi:WRKY DNA-binding transcription factor 70-like [Apium graveolens]|uniref:WRKY DNA-binding transcription factor 70-like n=1 Tax=Apium graveolens TaxID=4045 RepID=UPI003D793313
MEKPFCLPENVAGDQKRATEVLNNGREFADQLRIMLSSQRFGDVDHTLSAGDLVTKILDSFEKSLLILQLPCSLSDEVSQVPVNSGRIRSEELDSGQRAKIVKDRRGCFKRRRTSEAETKVSSTPVDDGHAWRKYGQKSILNAKHPRHYYRCTHKFEQGCLATKQVQKTEEDPVPMYRTTYYGNHTCRHNYTDHTQFFLDSFDQRDSSAKSILLNFQQNTRDFLPLNDNSTSTCTYNFVTSNHVRATFGSSTELLSPAGSDHGDVISSGVYSCTTSATPDQTTSFEDQLEMMVAGVVDFDDDDDDLAMDSFLL